MEVMSKVLICLQILCAIDGATSGTEDSWEHKIRADLLENYDRKVLPVSKGRKRVDVMFAMKVSRLVKVDNKEQLLTVDTWVVQEWQNDFLTWNSADYNNTERVHFGPDETWVPDIALYNNGDDEINLAGGVNKFVTDVTVSHTGKCVWSGPATFKANCEMTISKWPFDHQKCELAFGSFTYGNNRLKLKIFQAKSKFTGRFVMSGDWEITDITPRLDETDHGDCCPFHFSEVVYTLDMRRKPLYFLFYLSIPCALLMILALTSFLIPAESGERIGFVTTVLLAMMVFLLLIPSFVPETSRNLPILGVNIQVTMIIITLVLFANVLVLKVYFMDGTPPLWLQNLCNICGRSKRNNTARKIHVTSADDGYPVGKSTASMAAIELSDSRGGTPPLVDKGEEISWQKLSIKMDHAFFVIFLIVSAVAYGITYTH